jgi:hypothetical protein
MILTSFGFLLASDVPLFLNRTHVYFLSSLTKEEAKETNQRQDLPFR